MPEVVPQQHEPSPLAWGELVRIGLVALTILFTWSQVWRPVETFDLIGFILAPLLGFPIFWQALKDVVSKRMTMELSMTIALVAALVIKEVLTALVIIFFVLIAEVLEELTVGRGRRAIQDLLIGLPRMVEVRRGNTVAYSILEYLAHGDIVLVRPGGLVPVDGTVTAGNSFVDQSAITGESMPVEKIHGSQVFAGTINQSGILEIETVAVGRDTAYGRIIAAVEQAEHLRAPIQRVADRLAGYLVYFALICAALTYAITRDMQSTISVVIVAGACGIAAGTPLAILGAIGRAARTGAIVKGGRYIEALGEVDTVVLDKTGTLTLGNPEVVAVRPAMGIERETLLRAAASAGRFSEHPLARAIQNAAAGLAIPLVVPQDFSYTPGKGICSFVNGRRTFVGSAAFLQEQGIACDASSIATTSSTEVTVAEAGVFLGSIDIADVLRPEAAQAVSALREMKIRTILLTGDAHAIAESIGRQLQVDEACGDLLPVQKLERIVTLRGLGAKVAMVGDGVNDAPALTEADVGIAMGAGTEVARESADVLLIGNDLMKLVETIKIARRCRGIIMANFNGTLAVDGVGVALAAAGFLNPIIAVLIHVSSEMLFILNSARLLREK